MNVKNAIVQGKNYRFTVLTPVSYTHLDVYKRQCLSHAESA